MQRNKVSAETDCTLTLVHSLAPHSRCGCKLLSLFPNSALSTPRAQKSRTNILSQTQPPVGDFFHLQIFGPPAAFEKHVSPEMHL
jgi:hypothetical protein